MRSTLNHLYTVQEKIINTRQAYCRTHKSRYQVPIAELAERWTELPQVSDESRSFFRVHTGYFSNIPKCIKQSSSPVGHVLSPVLYRAPSVRLNLIVCLIELCTSFELRDKFGGGAGYNYVKRG
ncbi:hypothetical protein TNCV_117981 [Trichonephila clavipes]|nr:hypothetical protein TNCV_117981 [Trichonephila clavipes]